MIEFSYFLGIDQTGAAVCKGRKAKPLKVCLAKKEKKHWAISTRSPSQQPLTLPALTPSHLKDLLDKFEIDWPNPKLAILADSVFGMPKGVFPKVKGRNSHENLWELFSQTLNHSLGEAIFGMKVSEIFFTRFLKSKTDIPKRDCEEVSRSNSLFTTRPFQKNIQTGSYRIWRDLVSETTNPWINIWPFATPEDFIMTTGWLFEGYPSLVWRDLLGLQNRNSLALIKVLKCTSMTKLFSFDSFSYLKSDPDLCDAAVLALGGVLLQDQKRLLEPFPNFWEQPTNSTEGWISGLTKKKD